VGWLPDASARQIHRLLDVPTGKLMITMLAAIAEFERGSVGALAGSCMLGSRIGRHSSLPCHHTSSMTDGNGELQSADRPSDRRRTVSRPTGCPRVVIQAAR
jgi:hypothetical protein